MIYTIVFMVMRRNKVLKKKILSSLIPLVEDITHPFELVMIDYKFSILSSRFSKINEDVIEGILNEFTHIFLTTYTQKMLEYIVIYPEFDWDYELTNHQITIRFFLIGKKLSSRKYDLKDKIKNLCINHLGGDFSIKILDDLESTDLFIELLPIPFEEVDLTFTDFHDKNYFPSFYNKDLYSFLLGFFQIINNKKFMRTNKIKV